jgi:Arc-like DNA binding domain
MYPFMVSTDGVNIDPALALLCIHPDRVRLSLAKEAIMARKPTDTANLRLRLPEGLRKKLANEAEGNNRSLNSEILWRLGQTLSEEWQRFIAGMEKREKDEQERVDQLLQNPELREYVTKLVAKMPKKEGR